MKAAGFFVLAMALCIASVTAASAATVGIDAVPTGWRLQDYVPEGLVLWGAPAPECIVASNNTTKLELPSTATQDDKNQFWATMTAAVISGYKVFIYYDNTTCTIASFGMDGS